MKELSLKISQGFKTGRDLRYVFPATILQMEKLRLGGDAIISSRSAKYMGSLL